MTLATVNGKLRLRNAFMPIFAFHAAVFGGILTFGLWLYRLKRPIMVVETQLAQFE